MIIQLDSAVACSATCRQLYSGHALPSGRVFEPLLAPLAADTPLPPAGLPFAAASARVGGWGG